MEKIPKIILASRSPRRAALLRQMGIPFDVLAKAISEEGLVSPDPEKHVIELARRKVEAILDSVEEGLVIGADTIVFLEGEIFGKPRNQDEARMMLWKLSGKTHEVFTGFTLFQINGRQFSDVERTSVTFRNLEAWEIDDYVETGRPMDKAGGYGIQDRSGLFVDRIEGCFYNVVGFPLTKFYQGLKHVLGKETVRRIIHQQKDFS